MASNNAYKLVLETFDQQQPSTGHLDSRYSSSRWLGFLMNAKSLTFLSSILDCVFFFYPFLSI